MAGHKSNRRPRHPNVPDSRQPGSSTDSTSRIGVLAVGLAIERRLGWIFREQGSSDFGVDAQIEVREGGMPTGALIGLQIKSGPSYLREEDDECFVFRGTRRHLNYWKNHTLPIVVVLHDPASGRSFWQSVTDDNIVTTSRGWKLCIPKNQCIDDADEVQIGRLRSIANPQVSMVSRARVELLSPDSSTERVTFLMQEGRFEAAIVEIRQQLVNQPDKHILWETLAWSQYSLLAYPEALASINRALELDPSSEQSRTIRACILAEQGMENHDRQMIEVANAEFEILAERSNHWFDHYNLANTLRALGHAEGAETEYRLSLDLNPESAEAWTNLGTLLRSLHRHDEEIKCFDRALEISPAHPFALLNRGIYLSRQGGDPQRGAEAIEAALSADTTIASRDPIAWYWLIDAFRRAASFDDALRAASAGLAQHPTNMTLVRAQLNVHADLWRSDATHLPEAIDRFAKHLAKWPRDYAVRIELVRAHSAGGDSESAWRVLLQAYTVLGLAKAPADTLIEDFEAIGFSLEECITAFRYLPQYSEFRRASPATDSLAVEYYLGESESRPSGLADPQMLVHFLGAAPFGLAYEYLGNTSREDRDSSIFAATVDLLRGSIERIFVLHTRYFSEEIDGMRDDTERLAGALTDMMLMLSHAALIEVSRQTGWLLSVLGASGTDVDRLLEDYDYSDTLSTVAIESVDRLNRDLGILPDGDESARTAETNGRAVDSTAVDLAAGSQLPSTTMAGDDEVVQVCRRFETALTNEARDLTQRVGIGEIEVDAWLGEVWRRVQSVAICCFIVARGGRPQVTEADYATLTAFLHPLRSLVTELSTLLASGSASQVDSVAEQLSSVFRSAGRSYELGKVARGTHGIHYVRRSGQWVVAFSE